MKKLMLAVAFISFVGLTYANPCEDGKKCDKKDCKNKKECTTTKKECTSKDAKKTCCAGKESADKKTSCTDKEKTAGKSCCANKAKTEEKK